MAEPRKRRGSFRLRVFFYFTGLVLGTSLVSTAIFYSREKDMVFDEMTSRGRLLARGLAGASELGAFTGQKSFLDLPVNATLEKEDVVFVAVHDGKGHQIISATRLSPREENVAGATELLKQRREFEIETFSADGTRIYEFYSPIISTAAEGGEDLMFDEQPAGKEEMIGFVRVGLSLGSTRAKLDELLRSALIGTVCFLLIGAAVSMLIAMKITNPILALTRGTEAIMAGKLDQRIEIKSSDEIGRLTDAFNKMAADLKRSISEQQELNRNLEQEVIRRTAEIERAGEFVRILNSPAQMEPLLEKSLRALVSFSSSCIGALYTFNEQEQILRLGATVGLNEGDLGGRYVLLGSGLAGEAALRKEKIVLEGPLQAISLRVDTGIGTVKPVGLGYFPLCLGDKLVGLLILGSLSPYSPAHLDFIEKACSQLGIAVHNAIAYRRVMEFAAELERQNVELQLRGEQLQEQSRKLLEVNRLKSEFLANMSHELRTPLNAIMGYTELIAERVYGQINERQAEALSGINENATNLLRVISEILDLSKIEAGKMSVKIEDVDLKQVIADVVAATAPLTKERPYKIQADYGDGVPVVKSDRMKVVQILTNLISNAVKFTREGSIRVSLSNIASEKQVCIAVADTGAGIAKEDVHRIFDAFWQADGSPTRQHGGTGLGLTITKKFVEILGGEIWVSSDLGKGTTFEVRLPYERSGVNNA